MRFRLPFALGSAAALRSCAIVFLVSVPSTLPRATAAAESDEAPRAPFAVGFTTFLTLDARELGGLVFRRSVPGAPDDWLVGSPPVRARPVPLMVFYPVDWDSEGGVAPAGYPRNPFVALAGPNAVFTSTSFEQHGVDPAFQNPPPSTAGPFPLVVLSPGLQAPYWVNVGLATRLAGHGFVIALPAHYGEAAYATSAPRDPGTLGGNTALQRGLNRLYDIQLAIDVLLDRSGAEGDPLHGLVDPSRIAAGGHSIGGLSSLQIVGGDDDMCDTYPNARPLPPCNDPSAPPVPAPIQEPRIRALLLLDASVQLIHWNELQRVTVPAILIAEDYDSIAANTNFPGWLPAWAHQGLGGHPSYLVSVVHTAHNPSFTSACAAALVRGNTTQFQNLRCADESLTPYQAANELVWRYAVAFLNTELAGVHGYQEMLTPGWSVVHEPLATFYVNEKRNGLEPPAPYGDVSFVHTTQPNPDFDPDPATWVEW